MTVTTDRSGGVRNVCGGAHLSASTAEIMRRNALKSRPGPTLKRRRRDTPTQPPQLQQ
jgi:hypothetical protein